MRTSNTAVIVATVAVASSHILEDGGAGVSAFVPPTGGRASLVSKSITTRVMGGAGTARNAASAPQLTMDLSSLESKLIDAPAKGGGFNLPKVGLPDVKVPGAKIPEVSIAVPDVSLPPVELPNVDLSEVDLSIPPEVQSQIQSLLDKLSPQVQALLNFVAAELSASWAAYVAKLTGGDSATITATGWSALILVAIAANTAARGGAEANKIKAEEAAAAAASAQKKAAAANPFASGFSVPKGVTLQEVADVGKRLASGGGTVAVGGGVKAKPGAALAKKQVRAKPAPAPAQVAKKSPVVNPLANRRSEILSAKNAKAAGASPFASFGAKKAAPAAQKKAAASTKPFRGASTAGPSGGPSLSDLIADFQSKDEAEQRKLIGAGVAALLVGDAALGGGGGSATTAPPAPKPASTPKPVAPAPPPVVEEVEEVKVVKEPVSEPPPEPVLPPPSPVVVETPPPAPAMKPQVYERKVGTESFSSRLLEPIGGPSTPSLAPVREIRPAPPALTKEPWFKKSMDEYLKENAAEGDQASKAPLVAAGLLGLLATRSTLESSKELREQTQDAMDILEAVDKGEMDETDILVKQLDAKIAFFKDDDDLRTALEIVRDNLLVIQAKKRSSDAQ